MSTQHWKGPTITTVGDDLLTAWPRFVYSAGIITTASKRNVLGCTQVMVVQL